jgi:hypothetical protein
LTREEETDPTPRAEDAGKSDPLVAIEVVR